VFRANGIFLNAAQTYNKEVICLTMLLTECNHEEYAWKTEIAAMNAMEYIAHRVATTNVAPAPTGYPALVVDAIVALAAFRLSIQGRK
jgi:hypothetical protein